MDIADINDEENQEELINLLSLTYGLQRLFLNRNKPSKIRMEDVNLEWPIFHNTSVIFWHFLTLTNRLIHDFYTEFLKSEKTFFL